jgi:MOSC domain-containing protein YiiM
VKGEFAILSINVSPKKGGPKHPVTKAILQKNHGIVGDAHAGDWPRQVSLLADEDITALRGRGMAIHCGDFAENITTRGVPLADLPVGAKLQLGPAVLEITQIGKDCHSRCIIYDTVGDCVMPRKGVFARVVRGGEITHESRGYFSF